MKKDKTKDKDKKIRSDTSPKVCTPGTDGGYCTQCKRHCPLTALSCGRGERHYMKRLQSEDAAGSGAERESSGCGRERNQRKEMDREQICMEHGKGRKGNGKHSHGHHGEGRHGENHCGENHHGQVVDEDYDQLDISENLRHLIRSCADYLYRRGGQRNGQGRILRILSHEGEMTQKQLQEMLEIQAGSISEILSKMEDNRLIERLKDHEDKRRMLVSLTQQGAEHVKEYRLGKKMGDSFSPLTDEEKEQLKILLLKLLDSWKQH